jgi:hypothetical protein
MKILLCLSFFIVCVAGCGSSNSNPAKESSDVLRPKSESIKVASNQCPILNGIYSCQGGYGAFNGAYTFSFADGPGSNQSTYQITPDGKPAITYIVSPQITHDGRCRDGELLIFIQGASNDSAYGFSTWNGTDNAFDLQVNYYESHDSNIIAGCKKLNP